MPYDPPLAEAMRSALRTRDGVEEKKMFGGICWMLNGNMLCGVEVGRYMFRIGKERQEEALGRSGVEPVVFGGRRSGGLVWVDAASCAGEALEQWLLMAERFVRPMPVK